MKILLIKPKWFVENDVYKYKDLNRVPPLNLGIIAALSQGHEVRIIDEDVEEINYTGAWDLVGITAATFTSKAAYDISERFRKLGIKTVLGGVHPSLMPEEALNHCDSVVIGEAEPVWHQCLADCQNGGLRQVYQGERVTDMNEIPFPRRDLFARKYFHDVIQITRGCVNSCYYCYLRSVPWGKFRQRPVEQVYDEMAQIKNKYLMICDDNLFADTDYSKQIFNRIRPLKKRWWVQAPTSIAQDEELLERMAQAGCYSVYMGFQSVSQPTLDAASIKHNKVKFYREIVKKIHQYGILVGGFFMFGFDTEDHTIFEHTEQMIKEMDLDDAILYILTPYPGTKLFEQLDTEQRILNKDWSKYSWYNCNFQPKHMEPEELKSGFHRVYNQINKYFQQTFSRRLWKYKHWLFKDPRLAFIIWRNYHNLPDVTKLP